LRIPSIIAPLLFLAATASASEFRHVGDYLLKAHFKLAGT
jgi:hypothetical protein